MPFPPRIARAITTALGGRSVRERAERLYYRDEGHGYDRFGLHPDFVALGDVIGKPGYEWYFRVESHGAENIPKTGPGILAANHSGTLPMDGAMLWVDVLRNTDPPRCSRPLADYFVPSLPFVSTLFARCGVVGGSRGNAQALLEAGELLMIFPEGVPGIGKPFAQRYQLQHWTKGHCELAIRHRAPVIPIGIVGAEEQMPQIARIPVKGPVPYIPIPATLVPLPTKYHIHYGEPIPLHEEFSPDDADDPEIVRNAAARVKAAVQALLERGLSERKGIFR
ncbi:MAG: acyltransferase family protein [Alphaproteobacteria bacterium]|nr:acyltransferase family protein [Alphaproteobacteria bacterium]